MRLPDFFIIGAPKCGTTSLAAYLDENPDIFISKPKEPWFFSTDLGPLTTSWSSYRKCFDGATDRHAAVGEASVTYLLSDNAIDGILRFNQDAKFIVMLRNPVEMAYSLHSEAVYQGYETQSDFRRAWDLQGRRSRGARVPWHVKWLKQEWQLQYRRVCSVGTQLHRLFSQVDRANVKVVLFDEFKNNTKGVYEGVLEFLGARQDGRTEFPVYNESKRVGLPWLMVLRPIVTRFKKNVGIDKSFGVLTKLTGVNSKPAPRHKLPTELQERLYNSFREEIDTLETLLECDLGDWRE